MDEKELKQLDELERIPADRRTESEAAEYEKLSDKKSLQTQIKSAMETFFKDLPLLKNQKKVDVQGNSEDEKLKNPGYALSKRLVGMFKKDNDMIKTADPIVVSANDDAGGYLVPAVTEARITELIPTFGQARQYMDVIPVTGGVTRLPKEGTLPTWAYETSGTGENIQIADSKPTFDVNTITPAKGKAIVVISTEMLQDAIVNIGDYVIRKIAQAKGTGEDTQFFSGTGSPFTGVFATANTFGGENNVDGTNVIAYSDIVDVAYALDQSYLAGARWHGSRSVTSQVMKLVDDQNRPIWQPAFGSMPPMMMGYPYIVTEKAPADTNGDNKPILLLGNLINSIIGDVIGGGVSVKILTEATVDGVSLGEYDLVGIRVTARTGFTAGMTGAYSVLRCANT